MPHPLQLLITRYLRKEVQLDDAVAELGSLSQTDHGDVSLDFSELPRDERLRLKTLFDRFDQVRNEDANRLFSQARGEGREVADLRFREDDTDRGA